jgi:hypothetical protein
MRYRCLPTFAALLLLACATAPPATAGVSTAAARDLITVLPRIGIGPVRLGEKQRSVQRSLGNGDLGRGATPDRYYIYRSGSIKLEVFYDQTDRVIGISTGSPAAVLFGHPLSEGLTKLTPVFRAHHWTVLSCQGQTFTFLEPGGPGDGIAWRDGRLDEVQADVGGSLGQACLTRRGADRNPVVLLVLVVVAVVVARYTSMRRRRSRTNPRLPV